MKNLTHTLFSNYYSEDDFEEARACLMEDGIENPSDAQIYEFMSENESEWYREVMQELNTLFKGNYVVLSGVAGGWRGSYGVSAIGYFDELFSKIVTDCDCFKIEDDNGHLIVTGDHHDGTNRCELKVLTAKGETYYYNYEYSTDYEYDYDRSEMHRRMNSCTLLSRLPRVWDRLYK